MRVSRFLVIATGVLAVSCGSSQKGDLTAVGSPAGEVTGQLEVAVAFSKPMVVAAQIGEPLKQAPLAFSPAIEGETKWRDEKTLVFLASTNLPLSTGFTATVAEGIKAIDGSGLSDDYTFEFTSARLTGEIEVPGSAERAVKDQRIKLSFNQEVPFEQLIENCHYVAHDKPIAVKLGPDTDPGPSKAYVVVPAQALSLDTDWNLLCRSNLRGTEGNLGLVADVKQGFHTYGPLAYMGMEPNGRDIVPDEGLRLEIAFTNPLESPYQLKISPAVPGFPERCHSGGDAPPTVSCGAMLEPQTDYTITIDGAQKDIFGQSLGKEQVLSFHTTDAKPTVSMESGYFVAELRRSAYPIWTRNVSKLDVKAVEITPSNFHEIQPLLDWWSSEPADFKNTRLKPQSKAVAVQATENKWHQHALDPIDFFGGSPGPGMYYFEVGAPEVQHGGFSEGAKRKLLVNFTDIGLVSKVSATKGLVWTTRLSTGEPLPGVAISVRNSDGKLTWSGTTDAEGLATLPGRVELTKKPKAEVSSYDALSIFAGHQGDWTMVNAARTGGLAAWNFNVSTDYDVSPVKLRGFMHTDRGLYRPGETVHIKGLARTTKLGAQLTVPSVKKVDLEITGPRGNSLTKVELKLSRFGGFWTDIEMPGDARLGDYTIRAKLEHGTFTSSFSVEEYRPATFEVTGEADKKRVVRRGKVEAAVSANYFYGAPVRGGDVSLTVHSRPRRVEFPQFEQFDFIYERRYDSYYSESEYSQQLLTEDTATLTADGRASISVAVSPSDVSTDADLLVRASVTAPSNEVISKTFSIPYFRARRYFGINSPGYFLKVKEKQKFEIVGVSPAGKIVDGPAKVTVRRRDWNCAWEDWGYRGSYRCKELKHDVLSTTVQIVGGKPASFEFTPEGGGEYWVIVEGEKDNQAAAAVNLYAWGDGGGAWRSDDSMSFDIISDKKEYRAGDTATLILKTDLAKASGLVTIERDGVIEKRLIELTPDRKHLEIPITADHAPNVYVSVALVQGRMGKGVRGKPRMRMGLVNLPVRPEDNTLKVAVTTDRSDYRPGDEVSATVKVTDRSGAPVSAEVALTAADEGVLSLIAFKTPNPTPTFYSPWGLGVATATQLAYIKDIVGPNVDRPATGGDSGGPGSLRSRFVSTAVWKPGLVTDGDGVARVSFKAPDNLTAFRVMAVAADAGHRFGSTDKRFTVSKPLQLHRSLPRFLTLDDKLEGGVVVHNETGKAGKAKVRLVANDVLGIVGQTEKTVEVPKGGRIPVLFEINARKLGEAELTFSASMAGEKDAVRFKLPVHHPSPEKVLRVAHGATKADKSISIKLPANAIVESAEIHVSVDPDGLAGIEDGLRDLIRYPYGCLEQTTSKVIPMIAVRSLAESLELDGLRGDALEGFVKAGITKIGRHQTAYGGYSLWPGGHAQAYYTAYALWGLHLAKKAGYKVDDSRIQEGLSYLREDGKNPDSEQPFYSSAGNEGAQAFSLYVRAMLGDKDTQSVTALGEVATAMPVYGKAYMARALAFDLGAKDPAVQKYVAELSLIAKAAVEKNSLIDEPDGDELSWYMSDSLRTTAMVLDALLELDPGNASIKPLVALIMAKRRVSYYVSTQANLYVLLALTHYAESLSGTAPRVVVAVGEKELVSGALKGKQRVKVASMSMPGATASMIIRPKGEVHYNLEVRYRQRPETLKAVSNGLTIKREYLDEKGKPKSSFKVGDVVIVRLTSPVDDETVHFMVSDRLPAGFEALNTRFATVGPAGANDRTPWGTYRELRDERADFTAEYLWSGSFERQYMVRAIAEGRFALPPSVAELMYEPEKNAHTAIDYIEIKGK